MTEYETYNNALKTELPEFMRMSTQFIDPLFHSFYYMQLNIFYTLHEKMQHCDIGYFDLTLDVEEAFHRKRGDIQEQAEKLSIVKFKTTGQKRPPNSEPNHDKESHRDLPHADSPIYLIARSHVTVAVAPSLAR